MNTKSERFEMRLDQEILDRIDSWRATQENFPSRAESIRRLVEQSLRAEIKISDGERLITLMICELYKALNMKGEINPAFIKDVFYGGHYWALEWQYSGIFHNHQDNKKNVSEVVDILDMWKFIETGYQKLTAKEKKLVQEKTNRTIIKFSGFDGNNESEYMNIALFMIKTMGRFPIFKGRELNSHCPSIDGYRRMLSIFLPIRNSLIFEELSSKQIIDILNARIHSEHRQPRL